MTKIKLTVVAVLLLLGITVLITSTHAQFRPCVYPNTCGGLSIVTAPIK